jgi:Cytochrome P460
MPQASMRALKWLSALGSCGALIVGLTMSEARGAKEDQLPAASAADSAKVAPVFGIMIPRGYRDWRLVSVAHEAGSLNDIRAILGNDLAIKSYRDGKLPFPDGTIIARISWNYVPSEENDKVFGHQQSFVAGSAPEWYLQFMVKDSKKYATTRGWGYAQFDKDGNPANAAKLETCAPCHEPANANDYVFTHYAP